MTKEKFIKAIDQLQAAENLEHKVATAVRQYNNLIHCDYPEPFGMVISHAFLVMELLEEIMSDEYGDITMFCIDLEYGKKWYPGCIEDEDGNELDFSSAEKLWEVLNSNKERKLNRNETD